jgi:hypothetical protein
MLTSNTMVKKAHISRQLECIFYQQKGLNDMGFISKSARSKHELKHVDF